MELSDFVNSLKLKKHNKVEFLPKQMAAISYDGPILVLKGGVGSGKSLCLAYWLLKRLTLYPKAAHFVFASDYPQIRKGFMKTFMQLLDDLGIKYKYRQDIPTVTLLSNGAKLESLSCETKERVRSIEIDTVLAEEIGSWTDGEAMWNILCGRLRVSPGGKRYIDEGLKPQVRGTFNPTSVGSWLWKKIEIDKTIPCLTFSTYENWLLPQYDDYIEMLHCTISPDRWKSELEGQWSRAGGAVVRGFLPKKMTSNPVGLPKIEVDENQSLILACDFNVGIMCWNVMQQHQQKYRQDGHYRSVHPGVPLTPKFVPDIKGWKERLVYIIDEIHIEDCGVPDAIEAFIERYGDVARKTGLILYGDASGGARAQSLTSKGAARSNWDIILNALGEAGILVEARILTSNPSIMDRVNAFNAQVKTKAGMGLLVNPKCKYTLKDINELKYMPNSNKIDTRDMTMGHHFDAISYMVHFEYELSKGNEINLQQFNYFAR